MTARLGRGWPLALLCLGVAAVLHLPSFLRPVWNADEAFVATQAQVVDRGGDLYRDGVDRKPPVVPYVYAAAFTLTGDDDLWGVRVLAILAHAGTAVILAYEARRRWPARADVAGLVAAGFALAAGAALLPEDSQAANFEVFMLPAMAGAFVLGARRRPLAAGGTLALATLTKQNAATTLLPLAWDAWHARRRGRALALLGAGFVVPIVLCALWFGARDFTFWVFTSNTGYLDAAGDLPYVAANFALTTLVVAAGFVGMLVLLPAAWQERRDQVDLWLWLLAAVIGVLAGLRFFGHYYLQLAPPLALLAAGAFVSASARRRRLVGWLVVLPTAALVVVAAVAAFTLPRGPTPAVVEAVRERTEPGDRVLVWGHDPEIYWRSDRPPATRFLTTGFLTGHTGGRSPDRVGMDLAVPGAWDDFEADLRAHPPALIVDVTSADVRNGRNYRPADFPRFDRYLEEHYRVVATVDGVELWERR